MPKLAFSPVASMKGLAKGDCPWARVESGLQVFPFGMDVSVGKAKALPVMNMDFEEPILRTEQPAGKKLTRCLSAVSRSTDARTRGRIRRGEGGLPVDFRNILKDKDLYTNPRANGH